MAKHHPLAQTRNISTRKIKLLLVRMTKLENFRIHSKEVVKHIVVAGTRITLNKSSLHHHIHPTHINNDHKDRGMYKQTEDLVLFHRLLQSHLQIQPVLLSLKIKSREWKRTGKELWPYD